MAVFRVGAFDAEVLEKEFAPQFTAQDLVNLGFSQVYLKLMIDGVASPPFSAVTFPSLEPLEQTPKDDVIDSSRGLYGKEREGVEDAINKIYAPSERKTEARLDKSDNKEDNGRMRPAPPRPAGRADGHRPLRVGEVSRASAQIERREIRDVPFRENNSEPSAAPGQSYPARRPPGHNDRYERTDARREHPEERYQRNPGPERKKEETHQPFAGELKGILDQVMSGQSLAATASKTATVENSRQSRTDSISNQEPTGARMGEQGNERPAIRPFRDRTISEDSRRSLRDALAGIVKKEDTVPPNSTDTGNNPKAAETEANIARKDKANSRASSEPNPPQEVPAEVLRKILESE
jgi:hypothetical protein